MKAWIVAVVAVSCGAEPRQETLTVTVAPSASSVAQDPGPRAVRRMPERDPTPPAARTERLTILIDDRGRLFVNGQPVANADAVTDEAREHVHRVANDDPVAIVMADRSVPYSDLVRVIDALREGGIRDVNLAVSGP